MRGNVRTYVGTLFSWLARLSLSMARQGPPISFLGRRKCSCSNLWSKTEGKGRKSPFHFLQRESRNWESLFVLIKIFYQQRYGECLFPIDVSSTLFFTVLNRPDKALCTHFKHIRISPYFCPIDTSVKRVKELKSLLLLQFVFQRFHSHSYVNSLPPFLTCSLPIADRKEGTLEKEWAFPGCFTFPIIWTDKRISNGNINTFVSTV